MLIKLKKSVMQESSGKFLVSNSLNLAELVVNELMKSISKNLPVLLFASDLSLLNVKIQELITKELDNFTKVPISIIVYSS